MTESFDTGGRRMRETLAAFALALALALPGFACAADASLSGETFVVDAGHGTRFPSGESLNVGAVGHAGVAEEAVTLDEAEDLAALLRRAGATVVLTRSHAHPYRIATDKAADNRARAELANRLHATAFIAIHADGSLDASERGTSVFWLKPNSAPLANAVRAALKPLGLGESQFRARSLAVTRVADVPAVLVEIGFVSNPEQERLLASPDFQQREAQALFDALEGTFGK